jgi:hypothetical protein
LNTHHASPDPRFLELKGTLAERLAAIAASITPDNFASLLDPPMRSVLKDGFADAEADEGTVWLPDAAGEHLIPAYNTGPHWEKLVGKFQQPLNEGLICMVMASEQSFIENDVWKNARQSKRLDEMLNVETYALIAVPFYFLKSCQGVISCVQLKHAGQKSEPRGFNPANLESVQRAAALLSRLIDLRILSNTIGWTSD